MAREGCDTRFRFFSDDDRAVPLHWYKVPRDRPINPNVSFVGDAAWYNENGYRGNMCFGFAAPEQGEDLYPFRGYDRRRAPQPWEQFTGHLCGTKEQWAGDLQLARPEDLGQEGCCADKPFRLGDFLFSVGPPAGSAYLMGGVAAASGNVLFTGNSACSGEIVYDFGGPEATFLLGGSRARAGTVLISGCQAEAGAILVVGTTADPGLLLMNGQSQAVGQLVISGSAATGGLLLWGDAPSVASTDGLLMLDGAGCPAGTFVMGGEGQMGRTTGLYLWGGVSPGTGGLVFDGDGTPSEVSAPCQEVDFDGIVATVTAITGDCTCLPPSPWSPTATGLDNATWASTMACTDLISLSVNCLTGQYVCSCSTVGSTVTLTAFTASPLSVTWHVSGSTICGGSGGSFDFTIHF